MAKKRKASRLPARPTGPKEYDPADARLGPISTFEDIADEQEQHFIDQDKIMFGDDDAPESKRQKRERQEDAFLEQSDEDAFDRDSDDSDDEEYQELKRTQQALKKAQKKNKKKAARDDSDDEASNKDSEEEHDEGWWGSSRKDYYDNEVIETEDNAREEEEEARKLQRKQLSRMRAADFFDETEWAAPGADEDDKKDQATGNAVTMSLKTVEEIDSMTDEEKYKMLQALYPEFDYLCDEFQELDPQLASYKKQAEGKSPKTIEVVLYRSLTCYLSTIALYFSLLMAPTRDNPGGGKYLTDPDELHDHDIMKSLNDWRGIWDHAKRVKERREKLAAAKAKEQTAKSQEPDDEDMDLPEDMMDEIPDEAEATKKASKKSKKDKPEVSKKPKKDKPEVSKKPKVVDADLSSLMSKSAEKFKAAKLVAHDDSDDDDDDDDHLGEPTSLDAHTAAEKAKRKKAMGFYTAQLTQKSNKRAGAGATGGDVDIPYRERLKERRARLNAEAERRGRQAPKPGEELGDFDTDDKDDKDDKGNKSDKGDDDKEVISEKAIEYYNYYLDKAEKKKKDKAAIKAAVEAGRLDRVDPEVWQDETGRRHLTWQIEKNKGLMHKTLKEKKNNPRVKKRVKYLKKQKQVASMRHQYKEGVNRNSYQGERTGIKTGLIRSVKLG